MKLDHAVRVAEKIVAGAVSLSADERIALTVLTRLAKRVSAAKPSFKALARALDAEDLNQEDLFGERLPEPTGYHHPDGNVVGVEKKT